MSKDSLIKAGFTKRQADEVLTAISTGGLPAGGTANQTLVKNSAASSDASWATKPRWRGLWSAKQLIQSFDLSLGVPAFTTATNVVVMATSSAAAVGGTVPPDALLLRVGQSVALPGAGFPGTLKVVAPASASEVRFKHAHQWSPGGYGSYTVSVNAVSVRSGVQVVAAWASFTQAIVAGQFFQVTTPEQWFGGDHYTGESYVAGLEFWGTTDPYMAGDGVLYAGVVYVSTTNNNAGTPGAGGGWVTA